MKASSLEGGGGRRRSQMSSRGKCICMRLISTMHVSWLPRNTTSHQRHESSSTQGASEFTCAMTHGAEGH